MSNQQNPSKNTDKKISESEELKTDPMSEKDDVKAAEERTNQLLKKPGEKPKKNAR